MRIVRWSYIFVVLSFFSFRLVPVYAEEAINSYSVIARIQTQGTVMISEGIVYDFGTSQRHGIIRKIPTQSQQGPKVIISTNSINDANRHAYHYTIDESGGSYTWKIGDADHTVSGEHTYWINYTASNVIRHFEDHDELYWNAIGTEWPVAIAKAQVDIQLPPEISADKTQAICFTGSQGSKESDCAIKKTVSGYTITPTRPLLASEGMTISVSIPTGIVSGLAILTHDGQTPQGDVNGLAGVSSFSLPRLLFSFFMVPFGIVLFFIFFIWRLRTIKRAPKLRIPKELKNEPVVVAYEPPQGLAPVDVGVLMDRALDPRDVSSIIIDLAIQGYIKIKYLDSKILGFHQTDYDFITLNNNTRLQHPCYLSIYALLFNQQDASGSTSSTRDHVKMSELKYSSSMKTTFQELQSSLNAYLAVQGYSLAPVASGFMSHLSFSVNGRQIQKAFNLTEQGIDAFRQIRGFKEYIGMVEAGKIRLLDAPELKPEAFEKFLPYAMIFGVEKQWAQKFEGLVTQAPKWVDMSDSSMTTFSLLSFANSLSFLNNGMSSVFTPPSSSSGSSGFSGGSSGGGSGGGGGGSW